MKRILCCLLLFSIPLVFCSEYREKDKVQKLQHHYYKSVQKNAFSLQQCEKLITRKSIRPLCVEHVSSVTYQYLYRIPVDDQGEFVEIIINEDELPVGLEQYIVDEDKILPFEQSFSDKRLIIARRAIQKKAHREYKNCIVCKIKTAKWLWDNVYKPRCYNASLYLASIEHQSMTNYGWLNRLKCLYEQSYLRSLSEEQLNPNQEKIDCWSLGICPDFFKKRALEAADSISLCNKRNRALISLITQNDQLSDNLSEIKKIEWLRYALQANEDMWDVFKVMEKRCLISCWLTEKKDQEYKMRAAHVFMNALQEKKVEEEIVKFNAYCLAAKEVEKCKKERMELQNKAFTAVWGEVGLGRDWLEQFKIRKGLSNRYPLIFKN